jgi:hypothetical protein
LGIGHGFAYNVITLGLLNNNQVGIDLSAGQSNGKIGWCNQNSFFGGRITFSSSSAALFSRYGIRITALDKTYLSNNNNLFFNPSVELNAEAARAAQCETIPWLVVHGERNYIIGARDEGNGNVFARFENGSRQNAANLGYGIGKGVNVGAYCDNYVQPMSKGTDIYSAAVFHSGDLAAKSRVDPTTGHLVLENLFAASSSSDKHFSGLDRIKARGRYLELTGGRAVGVMVDTTRAKSFKITRHARSPSEGGRVVVSCYDSLNRRLSGAQDLRPASSSSMTFYEKDWGGAWVTGVDSDAEVAFEAGETVARISVLIGEAGNAVRLRSFAIFGNTEADVYALEPPE